MTLLGALLPRDAALAMPSGTVRPHATTRIIFETTDISQVSTGRQFDIYTLLLFTEIFIYSSYIVELVRLVLAGGFHNEIVFWVDVGHNRHFTVQFDV